MRTILASMLCALATAASAASPMQPGLWELSMTQDGSGPAPLIARECIAQSDIDSETKTLPRPDGACKLSNIQRTAIGTTYEIHCANDAVTTQGRAQLTFAGDRYQGKVDLTSTAKDGRSSATTLRIDARRVGDCTK